MYTYSWYVCITILHVCKTGYCYVLTVFFQKSGQKCCDRSGPFLQIRSHIVLVIILFVIILFITVAIITSTIAATPRHTGNYSYCYDHYCYYSYFTIIPITFIIQPLIPTIHDTTKLKSYLYGFQCNFITTFVHYHFYFMTFL